MKKLRIPIILAALLLIAAPTHAGESCHCDLPKRAALDVCRVVRQVAGQAAFRACILIVKSCEK